MAAICYQCDEGEGQRYYPFVRGSCHHVAEQYAPLLGLLLSAADWFPPAVHAVACNVECRQLYEETTQALEPSPTFDATIVAESRLQGSQGSKRASDPAATTATA